MSDDTPSMTNRALIGRIARTYLAPRWKGFAVAVVSAVIIAILTTRLIGIIQPAVDDILNRHKPGALVVIPLTIAGLALARGLFQVIQANFINRIGNGVVGDVQVQLFGRLVRADLARLRGAHSGA